MPKISLKGMNLPTSPIRKLSKYAEEAKAKGIEVIHLNIGQPDIQTPAKALDAIKSFDQKVLTYGPSEGSLVRRRTRDDSGSEYSIPRYLFGNVSLLLYCNVVESRSWVAVEASRS